MCTLITYASARECARSPALGRARCVSCARSPTYVRTRALSFHRTYVRMSARTYVRTCESTYVRTYKLYQGCQLRRVAHVRTYARAYVRTYVLTCVTRVGARVCAASVIASAQAPYRPGKVKECLPQATADQPGDSGGFASPCQEIALVCVRACVFLLCMQGNSRRFGHVRTYYVRNLMSRPHRPPSWRARPWQRTCADHSAAAFHQRFTTMNVSYVRT